MKLIAHEEGRSLQMISMEEVRPLRGGGVHPLDLLSKIAAQYKFISGPQSYEQNKPIKFETGITEINTLSILILSLEIYSDGILVSTRNTDDSDLVLDQFVEWAFNEFVLRKPTTIIPRRYVSRMAVDIDGELDSLANSFRVLGELASKTFGAPNLSVGSIQIGPFPPGQYPHQLTWTLSRRVADPPIATRYISQAPLASAEHYQFLESIETALRQA